MNEDWLFFEHLQTKKIFAENVTENNMFEETLLHVATHFNDLEIVNAVIEGGVDINAKTEPGATALHWAAVWNNLDIGKALTDAGADLNIKWDNQTAFEIAATLKRHEFAEMLRKKMKK
jgi:ankyrin repeat protein